MADPGKRMVILRRCAQTLSAFLLVYILWNTRYPLSGYINPEFYFQIDPFAMVITSIAERVLLPGLLYAIALLFLTVVLGRFFCGWLCPLGALLDLFSYFAMRIKNIFRRKEREADPHPLRRAKYGVLAAVFIVALFGVQLAWTVDPITIFVRAFSFNAHPFIDGAVNSAFVSILDAAGYPEWLESAYNSLREGFLSLSTPYFPHTGPILGTLIAILALCLVKRRFWCRYLCPLGATLALPARFSLLKRDVELCTATCGSCNDTCRMNAIREDNSYIAEECILCMDCMADCPRSKSSFSFRWPFFRESEQYLTDNYRANAGSEQLPGQQKSYFTDNNRYHPLSEQYSRGQSKIQSVRATGLPITIGTSRGPYTHITDNYRCQWGSEQNYRLSASHVPITIGTKRGQSNRPGVRATPWNSMTREQFIAAILAAGISSPLRSLAANLPSGAAPRAGTASRIRPPGALPEDESIQRCIRCGACMKVCPTNVLQPSPAGSRPGAAWAPALDTRRGYCEYQCNLCGQVCPTGAIRKLSVAEKQHEKIGIAVFNKKICLPYAKGEDCIVCEEHCPVQGKAIRVRETAVKGKPVRQPYVVADLCIGCAICELKCPTAPDKGILILKVRKA